MRLRFGAMMPTKGGRTALIGVEVREARDPQGRYVHEFIVGHVERVSPGTVEAAAGRLRELAGDFADLRPCVIVDTGNAQGEALRAALRQDWPSELHRPHQYPGTGDRKDLFASFLQAYSTGRVRFRPKLPHRAELDKALVHYLGGGVSTTGVELKSEDEALVVALGLAMFWPRHGAKAADAGETKKAQSTPEG